MTTRKTDRKNSFVRWLLCATFFVHATICLINSGGPIADWHSYRQSQTALSVRSYIEGGWSLFYETPIVGYPWQVPMEFPVYQTIVYFVHGCLQGNLEMECRLVSLFFFYGAFLIAWRLLPRIMTGVDQITLLLAGAAVLGSSYYLYWADAILIESLGLFLALCSALLYAFVLKPDWRSHHWLFLILISSILALLKVTIYVGIFVPIVIWLFLPFLFDKNVTHNHRIVVICGSLCMVVINYALLNFWVTTCDEIKTANPLAAPWASGNLIEWNFGSLEQRLIVGNWVHYFKGLGHFNMLFWLVSLAAFVYTSVVNSELRRVNLILLSIMFTGPIVFFNLYKVHTYYDVANNWALILMYVVNFAHLSGTVSKKYYWNLVIGGLALGMFVFFAGYRRFLHSGFDAKFVTRHANEWNMLSDLSGELKPGILVSFLEPPLNSVYSYHLKRKLIMFPANSSESLVSDVMNRNEQQDVVGVIVEPSSFENWSVLDSLTASRGWVSVANQGDYRIYH